MQEALRDGCGFLDCRIGNDDLVFGNITSITSSSIEGLKSSHSLGSKSFNLKGNGCVNQSLGDDLLKICSCSFCLKALGKSQREVASVIQRIDSAKSSAPYGPSTLEKNFKMEAHLKNQGKSLFLHMQNGLIQESSPNQVSCQDLREKCKMDLEAINRTSSSKH